MREMVSLNRKSNTFDHPDLHKSRILKDEAAIQAMYDILCNSWKNPFGDPADVQCLSTGAIASNEIVNDLMNAHEIGEKYYKKFIT